MALAVLLSRAVVGFAAPEVCIEVHLSNGFPRMTIVGLPETVVRESKERVFGAILNSCFEFPARRVTVNLGPANLPKQGGHYDLAIALGILMASSQLTCADIHRYEFAAELGLSGDLRPVGGILAQAIACKEAGRILVVAPENVEEALIPSGSQVITAPHLVQIYQHLHGMLLLPLQQSAGFFCTEYPALSAEDLSEVRGQEMAKRVLEIAAAGGHSLLFYGPPGVGKTLLASRLPGLMPPLTEAEALEVLRIYSLSQNGIGGGKAQWRRRPFRAPHHSASVPALVGGGPQPKPGEISLAHHGVLFLDEFPEFSRNALEALREPLEAGFITISRVKQQMRFPAQFQLIAAMNPCPCGYYGDLRKPCRCSPKQIDLYHSKISGPLLDRIDLLMSLQALPEATLLNSPPSELTSAIVRARVQMARELQLQRQQQLNCKLQAKELDLHCQLTAVLRDFLIEVFQKMNLSARAYHRLLRVARTIADLTGAERVEKAHLLEALSYRNFVRNR